MIKRVDMEVLKLWLGELQNNLEIHQEKRDNYKAIMNSQPVDSIKDEDAEEQVELLEIQKRIKDKKAVIKKLKNENSKSKMHLKRFDNFVTEKNNLIGDRNAIHSTSLSNDHKKESLKERRANYLRFKCMYEYNIRKMFRELYSIFFNIGTKHIKKATSYLQEKKLRVANRDSIEELNTFMSYIIMIILIAGKLARLNYSCLYKFFGSRSSLMLKDRKKYALGMFVDPKSPDINSFMTSKKFVCLDFLRILEQFRLDRKEIEVILGFADLQSMLEMFKVELFQSKEESLIDGQQRLKQINN